MGFSCFEYNQRRSLQFPNLLIFRTAPVYTAELSPPKLRGFFVGMNGVGITTGYAIAAYMGLAFFSATNPAAQWRGPLGLALVFPFFMLLILFIVPESPRYLLMKGKVEEAREIVMKLHHVPDDPDQEYARGEFYQMQKQAEYDRTLAPTWKEMFVRPSYRRRVILGCAFAFIGQSTAVLVINNYGPTLYEALGYDTRDRLILQAGWVTVGIPFNTLGKLHCKRQSLNPSDCHFRCMYYGSFRSQTSYGFRCSCVLRVSDH